MFYVENGVASGSILLDAEMSSGMYYIQAYTSYGNNFLEDESFTTSVQIINPEKSLPSSIVNETYDIQLLPEGGYLVKDVMSVVGCKILDANGKGVYITDAVIKNDLGQTITSFKTNNSGLGKFSITPKTGRTYKVVININGTEKEVSFPEIRKKGVVLNVSKHVTKDFLLVYLKTNIDTYTDIQNQKYHMVIHQDKHAKALTASFVDNSLEASFIIPFKDLYPGTNTITVFDQLANPIAERLMFNHAEIKKLEPVISGTNFVNDSVKIMLRTTKNDIGSISNMSVSVLPENTVSNMDNENIFASLLVKPYIKGHIQDPDQYFNKITRKSLYNLDLLLLTQGWSKYNFHYTKKGKPQKHLFQYNLNLLKQIRLRSLKHLLWLIRKLLLTLNLMPH